ncbi:Lanthionine synthetase C-like protein [Coccidioides posadasii C735 delta SOWgp]|uniref:Lanthionine synthetase C family protein n=2 Tax=Coccidioides posadasii TaxID=199306 RepID=A0A0J6FGD7_COCPO|nr:Lanthionine synthetase C-like protein [Coccidioides posadasii C735 delta SOWgp]EER27965.1 Lanthionine synthetase C-like protein [Coccidioides posadasii C735 delta SOWgp]KMM67959.1 hypothetical protein CPAG_04292 [Coccidioides posadasii RMSCC 3488]|eukprot:XP_003070110.1 Lanthionine synthetase C-like protein [Coccidioides posadasii C735 delta SOWgp]
MATSRPQYFSNDLQLVAIEKESLTLALSQLCEAVRQGVEILLTHDKAPDANDSRAFGTIYDGHLGTVLMALRLQRQAKYFRAENMSINSLVSETQRLASSRLNPHIMKVNHRAGRLSPLDSASFGAAVVRILAAGRGLASLSEDGQCRIHKRDIAEVQDAMHVALHQGDVRGGDELLYGRIGLLHAILNIRKLRLNIESVEALTAVFEKVPQLIDSIMSGGKLGARDYLELYGEREYMPLMWSWHDKYYIGAIHGTCGILDVLLACEPEELRAGHSHSHIPVIAQTINALCNLCILNHGHLPSSVPHRSSSRTSPLVQICHGAPGLLILLSNARKNAAFAASYWRPEWDEAICLASEKVWEQGLLYKGGSLCHGIAGNAWPLLMLHDAFEYGAQGSEEAKNCFKQVTSSVPHKELSGDYYLSRAIAMLLEARKTPPFIMQEAGGGRYRMPDSPYSLFEGLGGTICAWSEACVVISARLRKMEVDSQEGNGACNNDEEFHSDLQDELGMPGLGTRGFL